MYTFWYNIYRNNLTKFYYRIYIYIYTHKNMISYKMNHHLSLWWFQSNPVTTKKHQKKMYTFFICYNVLNAVHFTSFLCIACAANSKFSRLILRARIDSIWQKRLLHNELHMAVEILGIMCACIFVWKHQCSPSYWLLLHFYWCVLASQ